MDIARGGRNEKITNGYSASSWFRYTDTDCDYTCQAITYLWWGYCVYSGMCQGRSGSQKFENEFKFLTKGALEVGDTKLFEIFRNSGDKYFLPTRPVDGKYHGYKTCVNGANHGGED